MNALPFAPRVVPLRATLSLMNRGYTHFGYFIVFIASFLMLLFVVLQDTQSEHFRDDFPRVAATVLGIETQPVSRRETQWHTYHYRYQVNGKAYQGSVRHPELLANTEFTVQYVPDNPAMSRVDNVGNPGMPKWVLGIPAAIYVYALHAFWRAWAATKVEMRMIREGRFATATVRRVNRQAILDFTTESGEQWQFQPPGNTHALKQGSTAQVVYVPGRPAETALAERLNATMRALIR